MLPKFVRRFSSVSIPDRKKILIVGSNGTLGTKLVQHWCNVHELFLVDKDPAVAAINQNLMQSDLMHNHITLNILNDSKSTLRKLITQSDVVVHLAARNPFPDADWQDSMDTLDMVNHVLPSTVHPDNLRNGKKTRIIFASSNHVMGGYRKEGSTVSKAIENGYSETALFDPNKVPMNPGTKIKLQNGYEMDATPYAMPKVFGERLALNLCKMYPLNIESVILRIGWNQSGKNLPSTLSAVGSHSDSVQEQRDKISDSWESRQNGGDEFDDIDECEAYFKNMWLSNCDLVRLFDAAVNYSFSGELRNAYTICNGVSNNTDSRWSTVNDIGYKPRLNVHDYDQNNHHRTTKEPMENI